MAARPNLKILTHPPLWLLMGRLGLAGLLLWLGTLTEVSARSLALYALGWVLASVDVALRLPAERRFETLMWLTASVYAFFVGLSGSGLICAIVCRAAWEAAGLIRSRAFTRERKQLDILPESATVFHGGQPEPVAPERVTPGEAVVVQPGTVVPADALVVKGESLAGLYALTGEAQTVMVGPGSRIYAGMNNETGLLAVKAERTGEQTLARVWRERISQAASEPCGPEKRLRLILLITGAALALAGVLFCVLPSVLGWGEAPEWRQRAAGMLMASCPLAAAICGPALRTKAVFDAARAGGRAGADTLWALSRADMAVLDESGLMTAGRFEVTGLELEPGADRDSLLRCARIAWTRVNSAQADAIRSYCGDVGCEPDSHEERHGGGITRFSGHVIHAGQPFFLRAHGIECTDEPATALRVALDGRLLGSLSLGGELREGAEGLPPALASLHMDMALMTGLSREGASVLAERLGIRDVHDGLPEGDKPRVFEEILAESRGKAILLNPVTPSDSAAVTVIPDAWEHPEEMRGNRLILPGHSPAPLAELVRRARLTYRLAGAALLCAVCVKAAAIALTLWEPSLLWLAGVGEAGLTLLLAWLLTRPENRLNQGGISCRR